MAYTSDKKPGGLTQVTSVSGTDNVVVDQSGDVKRATVNQVIDEVFAAKTSGTTPATGDVVIIRRGSDIRQLETQNLIPDGTITNAKIPATSSITDDRLSTINTAGKVTNNAVQAVSTNTADRIVTRDGSGNFAAGTITATLSGNASTATILQTGRTIAMTGDVTYTSPAFNGSANVTAASTIASDAVTTAKINNAAVTFDKIQDSAAGMSVVGRSANSAGDFAEIAAATDGHILRRSGTTVAFGTLATAGITDGAVTFDKIQDSAAAGLSVLGRSTNTAGDFAEINAATDGHVLRRSGTDIGFGTIATAGIADGAITNAKFSGSVGLNAWTTKTSAYTAVAGDRINADTTSAAFTITLPATPATYAEVTLADHAGTWETNNLTVGRNGSNINGGAADLTCDSEGKQILLRYEGATIGWRIYT